MFVGIVGVAGFAFVLLMREEGLRVRERERERGVVFVYGVVGQKGVEVVNKFAVKERMTVVCICTCMYNYMYMRERERERERFSLRLNILLNLFTNSMCFSPTTLLG